MSTVTVNGHDVLSAAVSLPAWGVWWADLELDDEAELSGQVTIDCAGLSLVGTVVSGGPWQGRSRYRVAAGAGGWGMQVSARSYSNDAGVKALSVLRDAADEVGEAIDAATVTGTLGGAWTRPAAPASTALRMIAPEAWHVGEDGVTRLGLRAASTSDAEYTITGRDAAGQWLELAADDLSELVPGVVVDGLSAVDVEHRLSGGTLRTRIWHTTVDETSRLAGSLSRIVAHLTEAHRWRGLWSYRVVAQLGDRLYLQAVRASSGMPDLQRVRQRYAPGYSAVHAAGSLVLVAFVDGDPSRPVVVAGDDPESPGYAPESVLLVGEDDTVTAPDVGAGRALRYGDTVMMPSGPAATPTPTVLIPNPLASSSLSRVFP